MSGQVKQGARNHAQTRNPPWSSLPYPSPNAVLVWSPVWSREHCLARVASGLIPPAGREDAGAMV